MNIRPCTLQDIAAICAIYNYYIENTVITFEETPVSIEQMRTRVDAIMKIYPWLVCENEGEIIGYAYASKWRGRSAYKYTAEVTVYLDHQKAAHFPQVGFKFNRWIDIGYWQKSV